MAEESVIPQLKADSGGSLAATEWLTDAIRESPSMDPDFLDGWLTSALDDAVEQVGWRYPFGGWMHGMEWEADHTEHVEHAKCVPVFVWKGQHYDGSMRVSSELAEDET